MKKKTVVIVAAIAVALIAAVFFAILYPKMRVQPSGIRSGDSRYGHFLFTAYGESAQNAMDQAHVRLQYIENAVQHPGGEYTDIARINANSGSMVQVDPATIYLVERAYDYAQLTGGLYMPLDGLARRVWGFDAPPEEEWRAYLTPNPEMRGLYVDFARDQVGVDAGQELDLSGIVTAYCVDQAAAIGRDYALESAMFQVADAVYAIGRGLGDSMWSYAIPHPTTPGETLGVLLLENQACSTVGMFQGTYEMPDGSVRPAIIDARTMEPVDNDIASVTVIGSSAVGSAAIARAILTGGRVDGEALLYEIPGSAAVIVMKDQSVWISPSIRDRFALRAEGFTIMN